MLCAICNAKQKPQLSLLTPKSTVIEELKDRQIIHRDSMSKKICVSHYAADHLKKTTNGKTRLSNPRVIPTENLVTPNMMKEENLIKPSLVFAESTPKAAHNSIMMKRPKSLDSVSHRESTSKKKNETYRRKTLDKLMDATPHVFKPKPIVPNPFDELVHHLTKLQSENRFKNFEIIGNTIQCTFHPSKNVVASIKIRNAEELWVRVTFKHTREIVQIEDKSFGNYSIHLKIQRLVNLQNNLDCVQNRKEELFVKLRNWKDFTKTTNSFGHSKLANAVNLKRSQRTSTDEVKRPKIEPAVHPNEKMVIDVTAIKVSAVDIPAKPVVLKPHPFESVPVKIDSVSHDQQDLSVEILNKIREWMDTKPPGSVIKHFEEQLNTIMIC